VIRGAAATVAVLLLAAGSAGAAESWRAVADPGAGYSISVPMAWQVVPRSTPELNALIARLRKEKRAQLANQYAQIAATRRVTSTVYRFQAFAWPAPKGPVVPDVTVKTDPLTAGTTQAALPFIARQVAEALAASATATAAAPVRRTLPAGPAFLVTGTTRVTKVLRSRYAVYLLIHGRRLYSISFRGPKTAVEGQIIRSVRFG